MQHLDAGGFDVLEVRPTNFALFPVAVLARGVEALKKRAGLSAAASARGMTVPPQPLNRLLTEIFAAERFLLGRAGPPTGLSLLAVAYAKS
jgi:hypothetical protein